MRYLGEFMSCSRVNYFIIRMQQAATHSSVPLDPVGNAVCVCQHVKCLPQQAAAAPAAAAQFKLLISHAKVFTKLAF